MAFSALTLAPERRRHREAPRRVAPRSELHPSPLAPRIEDRLLPVAPPKPRITAIYPPLYRPTAPAPVRPSAVQRSRLPPVIAQKIDGPPAPAGPVMPASLPATPEMELPARLRSQVRPVKYKGKGALVGRVYEIPDWLSWSQTKRLAFMREFAEDKARDPHIAETAAGILKQAGVDGRDVRQGWAVLLRWMQENVRYVNEPNERLQSPQYSLQSRIGDCDDFAILLLALGHSLRWPARWVLSGRRRTTGAKVRWIEGSAEPSRGIDWAHIYLIVGGPAFKPTWWTYAEPTLKVPLGWDVVGASQRGDGDRLPELSGPRGGSTGALHGDLGGMLALGAADAPLTPTSMVAAPPPAASAGAWQKAMATMRGIAWLNLITATIPPILAAFITHKYILASKRK